MSRASEGFTQALGGGVVAANTGGIDATMNRQQGSQNTEAEAQADLLSQIAHGIGGDGGGFSGGAPQGGFSGAPQGNPAEGAGVSGGGVQAMPQQADGISGGGVSDMPNNNPHSLAGFTGVSNITPNDPMSGYSPMDVSQNPANSRTDVVVNRIAEAEREVKNERRSQWLQMNHDTAANVLGSISSELPSHLQQKQDPAQALLQQTMGGQGEEGPAPGLLRRMAEVAVRRVARKRGVAVETPQVKPDGDNLNINVTFVDDGRVLDSPADLCNAFQHAISTELALKGIDMSSEVTLFRSKDGEVEKVHGRGSSEAEDEEEMFACEMCSGLVKDSDTKCPHCGAEFGEEEEDPAPSSGGPPGGPSRGGPPGGPSRGGGPPGRGPSGGGPPGRGPSGGGPPGRGPSGGGPPGRGPSGGGPPGRGPGGGGPPGGPKRGGGPPGGPKGPKGPKRGPPR